MLLSYSYLLLYIYAGGELIRLFERSENHVNHGGENNYRKNKSGNVETACKC